MAAWPQPKDSEVAGCARTRLGTTSRFAPSSMAACSNKPLSFRFSWVKSDMTPYLPRPLPKANKIMEGDHLVLNQGEGEGFGFCFSESLGINSGSQVSS